MRLSWCPTLDLLVLSQLPLRLVHPEGRIGVWTRCYGLVQSYTRRYPAKLRSWP